jgi:diaminopimelate epimerase
MKEIWFTKLNGAGNDFILFDNKKNPDLELTNSFIRQICDRRKGIGADGVLQIFDFEGYAFDMKYFNADGSTGVLCGNGARCALKYGYVSGRIGKDLVKFRANGIDYTGKIQDEKNVKFFFNPPVNPKYNFKVKTAGQLITASFIDTGSPHLVIKIEDIFKNPARADSFYKNIEDVPVYELGKELRNSPDFAPGGTNVNFIQVNENGIKIRTFERGVENETLACGTGSVAAALISSVNENLKPPFKLLTKGGDQLAVDFDIENQSVKNLSLTGPAEITFNGELSI